MWSSTSSLVTMRTQNQINLVLFNVLLYDILSKTDGLHAETLRRYPLSQWVKYHWTIKTREGSWNGACQSHIFHLFGSIYICTYLTADSFIPTAYLHRLLHANLHYLFTFPKANSSYNSVFSCSFTFPRRMRNSTYPSWCFSSWFRPPTPRFSICEVSFLYSA